MYVCMYVMYVMYGNCMYVIHPRITHSGLREMAKVARTPGGPELPWATPGGSRGGPRRPESLAEAARGASAGSMSTEEVAWGFRGSVLDQFGTDFGSIWGGPKCLAYRQGRVAEHFCRNSLFLAFTSASSSNLRSLFDSPWGLFGTT